MNLWHRRAPLVVVAILLGGCGSGGSEPDATGSGWAWESEAIASGAASVPDGSFELQEGPQAASAPSASPAPARTDLLVLDPCTLVTGDEFAAWAGDEAPAEPMPLEEGEACGFINDADDARLAIGVIPLAEPGGERFVPPEAGGQQVVDDVGIDGATVRWIVAYPVEQSSTLVVEADAFDLVLEVSALQPDDESMKEAAIAFARLAAPRIPDAAP